MSSTKWIIYYSWRYFRLEFFVTRRERRFDDGRPFEIVRRKRQRRRTTERHRWRTKRRRNANIFRTGCARQQCRYCLIERYGQMVGRSERQLAGEHKPDGVGRPIGRDHRSRGSRKSILTVRYLNRRRCVGPKTCKGVYTSVSDGRENSTAKKKHVWRRRS